jgi:1-acyl-sn-glycerol-3-phosphate acyltransferase
MNNNLNSVKYPRRVLIRSGLITLGKVLLTLLADVKIHGKERLPKKGPMILAGNHAAALEAVMMAVYNPGMVEFIGNGDIPFDPNYAFIVKAYDLIPVNRGNLDRQGLNKALSILEQGGILGIFPEGGIWDPAQMGAQIGASWLSYRAQAPIIPVGFGGIRDGLPKAMQFKRPKLVMNVGETIPPVALGDNGLSLKKSLEHSASQLLNKINALVPEEDLQRYNRKVDEHYDLKVIVYDDQTETNLPVPEDLQLKHGTAYAHFLYNPTMMDVLVRNLHLPLCPMKGVNRRTELDPLIAAWDAVLDYLKVNPGYFTYRFGIDEGLAVQKAIKELRQIAIWAKENHYALSLNPIYRYRNAHTGAKVVERGGCFPNSMCPKMKKGLLG